LPADPFGVEFISDRARENALVLMPGYKPIGKEEDKDNWKKRARANI
jgi:hypothetical protein